MNHLRACDPCTLDRDCIKKNETAYFYRNFSAHIKVVRKMILEENDVNKKDSKKNLRIWYI